MTWHPYELKFGQPDQIQTAPRARPRLHGANHYGHEGARTELNAVYRRLLKMAFEQLRLIDEQIGQLDHEMASLLSEHQDAVERLAQAPGLGVDSAQLSFWAFGPRKLMKIAYS
jgi:hypothetical protein